MALSPLKDHPMALKVTNEALRILDVASSSRGPRTRLSDSYFRRPELQGGWTGAQVAQLNDDRWPGGKQQYCAETRNARLRGHRASFEP